MGCVASTLKLDVLRLAGRWWLGCMSGFQKDQELQDEVRREGGFLRGAMRDDAGDHELP